MEGLEYLLVEPACEVNEKGTREKNDGNEDASMDDNEKIEVNSNEGSFAEEDWNDPEQNILITDSDFILSDRTSAICITADMSVNTKLEADFKREYQNVEFLFRQKLGLRGMAALHPSVSQVPGKNLRFLVTRVNERNTIDPEHVMLALTSLSDFMVERGI